MELISKYFASLWEMTVLMHGYIIFGLITAGLIREFISDDFIKKNLGGKGLGSSVKAALIGLPLPICSCGVIPLAASLRKSGAGKGAVVSFYISTPMTGADSIIATYGVFGWVITLFRVVSASVAAIIAGVLTDLFTSDGDMEIKQETSCCSGCCCGSEAEAEVKKPNLVERVKNIFRYAFVELLGDIAYPLLTGLILAAAITLLVDTNITSGSFGLVGGYLIAFAVGIPLYVCSISAIPVALSLILAGFSPGAAFVFLAGAPATNMVAINVIKTMLGKRGMFIYLISIVTVTLAFAVLTDVVFSESGLGFRAFTGEEESFGLFAMLTAGMFLTAITLISVKQKIFR
jgi:uncharacterized membrane protein YraQ (UPF0718 family)